MYTASTYNKKVYSSSVQVQQLKNKRKEKSHRDDKLGYTNKNFATKMTCLSE